MSTATVTAGSRPANGTPPFTLRTARATASSAKANTRPRAGTGAAEGTAADDARSGFVVRMSHIAHKLTGMRAVVIVAALLALPAAPAAAVDRELQDEIDAAVELIQARQRIATGDFAAAEVLLLTARGRTPDDPDVHSLLGLCARKQGRLDESFTFYQEALRLDPDHRGAREYLGELHLQRDELALARAQLAELERLCPQGCEEREELADAIAAASID